MNPEYDRVLMTQIDNLNAENDQLKAEVERLREGIREHMNKVEDSVYSPPFMVHLKLWKLLKPEAGGAGR